MASETGVLDVPPEKVLLKDRIHPGRMFMLDTDEGRLVDDAELKSAIAAQRPYGEWLRENRVSLDDLPEVPQQPTLSRDILLARQVAFGYTLEDLRMIMEPMAETGTEPIGSMGNDTPLAVLSEQSPVLFNYFKQLFAQVSNPPLDAIREELVTSLESRVGSEGNLFSETPGQCRTLRVKRPVLTNAELEKMRRIDMPGLKAKTIRTLFTTDENDGALARAVRRICEEAYEAVQEGNTIIILSDRGVDVYNAPIPSLLAVAGVHHHLIRQGVRTKVS
ncbi:Ferredoxin-dependent glutamate synthase 1 [Geodia barretti]|uniref:glutamate synthase (ferredoxin) n=1 Tax=Geodia barretti TaxID=519541 RepID=A0AA35RAS3_GEOBA|nr:Ferredoxin-dependent glutamate synthase 1 [Geodia barretti]